MSTPAPSPLVPQGLQVAVQMAQAGQLATCVMGWRSSSGITSPTTEEIDGIAFKCWNFLRSMTTENTVLQGFVLRQTGGSNAAFYRGPAFGTVTSIGAQAPPEAVAAGATLIKWATANGSRSGKGRTFVPGLPASWVTNGGRGLTPGAIAAIQGFINAYLAPAGATGPWQPAVLSFKNQVAYPITAGSVSGIIGIQRKRMRG